MPLNIPKFSWNKTDRVVCSGMTIAALSTMTMTGMSGLMSTVASGPLADVLAFTGFCAFTWWVNVPIILSVWRNVDRYTAGSNKEATNHYDNIMRRFLDDDDVAMLDATLYSHDDMEKQASCPEAKHVRNIAMAIRAGDTLEKIRDPDFMPFTQEEIEAAVNAEIDRMHGHISKLRSDVNEVAENLKAEPNSNDGNKGKLH